MSYWTYINGTITVSPIGRTQAEKRYVLDTVLEHLPRVTGSEGDMNVYTIQKKGHNCSSSSDEFGQVTNNLVSRYGNKSRNGWLNTQDEYILVVDAALRDREFKQTYREFVKWIVRLGKRVMIEDVLVEINGYDKSSIIRNDNVKSKKNSWKKVFDDIFEDPTWVNEGGEPNWCEFMLWDRMKNSNYPMLLGYKFKDDENDNEVERRLNYR